MGAQLDYILQAFTVSIDGFGKAGSGEKTKLPVLKKITEKYRGGGMLMARHVALGYEAPEHEVDLTAFDPQVLSKGGLYAGNKQFQQSLRGYLDGDGGQHTAILQEWGEVIELDAGTWEAGKKAVLKYKLAPYAMKLTIDGVIIWDIDAINGVYNVGGTDAYQAISAALGF